MMAVLPVIPGEPRRGEERGPRGVAPPHKQASLCDIIIWRWIPFPSAAGAAPAGDDSACLPDAGGR